jgi:hypothetical protein
MNAPLYVCTFERIGRTHDLEPQTFAAQSADELAHIVYGFARRYLASNDVWVTCDLEEGHGAINAGRFGRFTITDAE